MPRVAATDGLTRVSNDVTDLDGAIHVLGDSMHLITIIIMEICKAPTLRLKALNKHTHIMFIEMENVII